MMLLLAFGDGPEPGPPCLPGAQNWDSTDLLSQLSTPAQALLRHDSGCAQESDQISFKSDIIYSLGNMAVLCNLSGFSANKNVNFS
jgi:hypothetical protein